MRTKSYLAQTRESPSYRAIGVGGEMDQSGKQQLLLAFAEAISQGAKTLIVNLDGVRRLNEYGVGALEQGRKMLEQKNGRLILVCKNPKIIRMLQDFARTDSSPFHIFDSDISAVEAIEQEIDEKVHAAATRTAATA